MLIILCLLILMNQPPTDTGNANRFPNLAHIFRILQFFKKRAFYKSHENLKMYHYQLIDDPVSVFPENEKNRRIMTSIWHLRSQTHLRANQAISNISSLMGKLLVNFSRMPLLKGI